MAKLFDGERLDLPIEIYLFKRQILWIVLAIVSASFALSVYIFTYISQLLMQESYAKLLGAIISSGVWLFISIILVKTYFSDKPIARLDSDTLTIFNLNPKKSPVVINWYEITKIDVYSHKRGNGLTFYLKNYPPFEDAISLSLYGGAAIKGKGQLMNTREIEHIFQQFIDYYKNNQCENSSNLPLLVHYHKAKKYFFDWA